MAGGQRHRASFRDRLLAGVHSPGLCGMAASRGRLRSGRLGIPAAVAVVGGALPVPPDSDTGRHTLVVAPERRVISSGAIDQQVATTTTASRFMVETGRPSVDTRVVAQGNRRCHRSWPGPCSRRRCQRSSRRSMNPPAGLDLLGRPGACPPGAVSPVASASVCATAGPGRRPR